MKCILLCVLFLPVFYQGFSQTTVILSKDENTVSNEFAVLPDPSGTLNIRTVILPSQLVKFRPVNEASFQQKIRNYWLRVKLQNQTGFDREWVADFQNWSYVSAYIIGQNGTIDSSHKTGHLYPYRKRDYRVANKAYLLMPIKADSTLDFFVRLESVPNTDLTPTALSFKVTSRSLIDAENEKNGKAIYVFLAIFLIMFIYNLFIYISVGLKSYAYYLALLIIMFYVTAANSGYIIEIFGSVSSLPIWLLYFDQFSSSIMGLSVLLFGTHFLQVDKRYPGWKKIINIIIILFIITGIIGVFDTATGIVSTAVPMTATTIVIVWLSIKSIKDKYSSTGYFLTGYAAFLISTIPIPLALAYPHIIPVNIWTMSYSVAIGSTIEIIMFSFALADMINALRLENFESQKKQQALRQEHENMQNLFNQELLKTQLEIQEQTFHNISQEIHDNIGQILSLIKVNIDHLLTDINNTTNQRLVETRALIIKVIHDIRDLSKTLSTDLINRIGLFAAIEQQLNLMRKTGQYEIQLTLKGEESNYGSQAELVVFRIVQELLTNILKHSGATTIFVSVHYQAEKLTIAVTDNGNGFNVFEAESANKSLGLLNIKNRIKMVNGEVSFISELQKGTTVLIDLPKKV